MSLHYLDLTESGSVQTLHVESNHNRIALISASIPKTFYLVDDNYNTFKIDETTHTIPEGNYTIDTFITAVDSLITPDTISFSDLTGKLTITSTTATTFEIPTTSRLGPLFGFADGSSHTFTDNTVTSRYIVNFQSVNQIYINADIVRDNSHGTSFNLLHTILVNDQPSLNFINFTNPTPSQTAKRISFATPDPTKIVPDNRPGFTQIASRFQLFDQNEDLIDFHGATVSLILRTWCDHNPDSEISKLPPLLKDLGIMLRKYFIFQLSKHSLEEIENKKIK